MPEFNLNNPPETVYAALVEALTNYLGQVITLVLLSHHSIDRDSPDFDAVIESTKGLMSRVVKSGSAAAAKLLDLDATLTAADVKAYLTAFPDKNPVQAYGDLCIGLMQAAAEIASEPKP